MNKSKILHAAILLIVVSLVLPVACVKVADQAPKAPAGNLPPVIASVTAAQNQSYPGGTVNLQSVVSDPNGDMINFKWTATGGEFVENGRVNTTWRAPKDFGNYEIKLTVDDGKGGIAQSTVQIAVSANHPPTITSLTADPAALQYASRTTLTCIASDQDGDPVQYKWEARDGTLSGEGNKVSWTSPSKGGNYSVFVTASDGKSAETRQEIIIAVAAPSGVQTFKMEPNESGTVTSEGDRVPSMYKAGDDEKNIGYRAFFSYNIFPLWNMDIKQARLKFIGTKISGTPYEQVTGIGGFQIRHLSYGSSLPKFNITEGGPVERQGANLTESMTEVDVTPELINDVSNRLERSQFEATFFIKTTNGNNLAEFVQWQDVVLEVTSAPK